MKIGEAADASGVTAKMIRYYEEIGLIAPAQRSAAGYRHYGNNDIHMLRFIRRGRELGFSMPQLKQLTNLWQDHSRASADVKRIATEHLDELHRRIQQLQEMADTLETLARRCHGDQRPDCPILEGLEPKQSS